MCLPVSLLALPRAIADVLAVSASVGRLLAADSADTDEELIGVLEVLLRRGHDLHIHALAETGNLNGVELRSWRQGGVLGGVGLGGVEAQQGAVVVVLNSVLKVHAVLAPHRFRLLGLEVVLDKNLDVEIGEHRAEGLVDLVVEAGEADDLGVAGDAGKEGLVLVGKVCALVCPGSLQAGEVVANLVCLLLGLGGEGRVSSLSEGCDLGGNSASNLVVVHWI